MLEVRARSQDRSKIMGIVRHRTFSVTFSRQIYSKLSTLQTREAPRSASDQGRCESVIFFSITFNRQNWGTTKQKLQKRGLKTAIKLGASRVDKIYPITPVFISFFAIPRGIVSPCFFFGRFVLPNFKASCESVKNNNSLILAKPRGRRRCFRPPRTRLTPLEPTAPRERPRPPFALSRPRERVQSCRP